MKEKMSQKEMVFPESVTYCRKKNGVIGGSPPEDRTEAKGRRPLEGSPRALPSEGLVLG